MQVLYMQVLHMHAGASLAGTPHTSRWLACRYSTCMQVLHIRAGSPHACRCFTCRYSTCRCPTCRYSTCMQVLRIHAGTPHACWCFTCRYSTCRCSTCRYSTCMQVLHIQVLHMHAGVPHIGTLHVSAPHAPTCTDIIVEFKNFTAVYIVRLESCQISSGTRITDIRYCLQVD